MIKYLIIVIQNQRYIKGGGLELGRNLYIYTDTQIYWGFFEWSYNNNDMVQIILPSCTTGIIINTSFSLSSTTMNPSSRNYDWETHNFATRVSKFQTLSPKTKISFIIRQLANGVMY